MLAEHEARGGNSIYMDGNDARATGRAGGGGNCDGTRPSECFKCGGTADVLDSTVRREAGGTGRGLGGGGAGHDDSVYAESAGARERGYGAGSLRLQSSEPGGNAGAGK